MSEQEELLKCNSLGEGVRYLREKEKNPRLTLEEYREMSASLTILEDLLPIVVAFSILVSLREGIFLNKK